MKLVITVIVSGEAFERIELERFDRVRVGRADDCEIRLENPAVSTYHCEIVRKGDLLRIHDLDSQNGTRVNGKPIREHSLAHGDVIGIGKFTLDVAVAAGRASARRERVPHGAMTLEGDPVAMTQSQVDAEVRVSGYLTFLSGPRVKDEPLILGQVVRFGRDPESEVRVGAPLLAPRLAAILVRDDHGFRLLDLSPRCNSVRVNGARASDVRLSAEDAFSVRGLQMTFSRGTPAGSL